ncbi:MAG: ATP-binding protein [Candidatus Electryonea clarkiae]|nr:ATP-binding protein [Candidatus Electryonea clarkiae]
MKIIRLKTLGFRLFFSSALVILITAAAVALFGYRSARKAILEGTERHVLGIVLERKAHLQTWLQQRFELIESYNLLFNQYDNYQIEQVNSGSSGILGIDSDLFDINHINKKDTSPNDLKELPEVERAFNGKLSAGKIHVNKSGIPVIDIAAPGNNSGKDIEDVFVYHVITSKTIDIILTDTTSLGYSGEVYLVGSDTTMLTPSRFHHHPQPLTHKMPIPPVLAALTHQTGTMTYEGFLGGEVIGAYSFIPEFDCAIIAEIDIREAFEPLRRIMLNTIITAVIALALMLATALALARTWTRPLERLALASRNIAEGNYSVKVREENRQDEIGTLAVAFNRMVKGLVSSQNELERSHQQLVQSEKLAAIGELVASVVHEMRNPLSAIKMNLRLLERKICDDPLNAEHLQLASGEVNRLESMLSDLLDYSKPLSLVITEVNLYNLTKQSFELLNEKANAKNIRLVLDEYDESIVMPGDEEQLLRALINLISNAIEASEQGEDVKTGLYKTDNEQIVINVIDNGCGMNANALERMYETFYTTREEGTGLGMNIVKKIVEAHDGSIDVMSTEGSGTTVRLNFPSGE